MAGDVGRLILLSQIMAEVSAQTDLLEDAGKQAVLDWLKTNCGLIIPGHGHLSTSNKPISLDEYLFSWFVHLPPSRAVLLYRLFMNEISRWQHPAEISSG